MLEMKQPTPFVWNGKRRQRRRPILWRADPPARRLWGLHTQAPEAQPLSRSRRMPNLTANDPRAVSGTIASCDDYDDIVDWGEAHLAFLRRFLPYFHGIPCADWLRTLMNRVDPEDPGPRKVHSLIDKVYAPANLAEAWRHVRDNKGGAGIDGLTIERLRRPGGGTPGCVLARRERERARTHRITRCATRDHLRQLWVIGSDFVWGRPSRFDVLALDLRPTLPLLASSADTDWVSVAVPSPSTK